MIKQLQDKTELRESILQSDPIVLCAADDNYVKPLAVTLHSATRNLRTGSQLQAIIFDGGISEENHQKLKETFAESAANLFFLRPDLQDVSDLNISHHITHTAYLRLLAGRILPSNIDKVIYLDSDLLVQDDLTDLWEMELDGNYALAVPDIACPFVDSRHADCNFVNSSPYFAAISPIANWKTLGMNPAAPYFNSGVMVLNVARMRQESIEEKLIACLKNNQRYVWCWDQYALNVVFANQWKPLPPRWNQGAYIFDYPDSNYSPLHEREFIQAKNNPAIIHFTTEWKPWHFNNRHP